MTDPDLDWFFLRVLLNQQVIMKALAIIINDENFACHPDMFTDMMNAQGVTGECVRILLENDKRKRSR